jgi:hypothetical protein
MTTAYAHQMWDEDPLLPGIHLHVVSTNTASGQGQDAQKVLNVVRNFAHGTAARGQSVESAKIIEAVKKLQVEMSEHIDNLRTFIDGHDDLSYKHIPVKTAFFVQATYKHIGKLKPRQFPLDE